MLLVSERLTRANTSPLISQEINASCCIPAKSFMPVASQLAFRSAHKANSRSVCLCHSLAASGERPSGSRSMELFSVSPTPTALVRFVLIALVARGLDIYSIRLRWRMVWLFQSISSLGALLRAMNFFKARRV